MALNLLDQVEQGLAPTKVDIVQFAESSDYCNVALYPGQATLLKLIFLEEMNGREEDQLTHWINGGRGGGEIRISPNIRERREFLRERGYKHFRLVELIGGRRSSKGFTTGLAMAYVMFNTLMLGDPGGAYGIDKEKDIYFSCVAGSESQAKEFQFGDFVSRVETCKAMEPYIVKSLETELRVATQDDLRKSAAAKARGNKIQRDIARLRGKALAANAGTLRGSATMVITIDEAAHLIPGESKSSLEQIFTAADPSLDQFGLDGMMFLNSSPYTKVGMFYEVYENCMKQFDPNGIVSFATQEEMDTDDIAAVNSDPRSMAFQYASWNLFEGYRYFNSKYQQRTRGKMFGKMPTVSPDWDPDEVDEENRECYSQEDKQAILQARAKEASNPEAYKVERRGKFAEVTDAYLNPSMVDRIYQGRPGELRRQPNGDIVRDYIPFNTNYGQDAINLHRYKFHLDPSSTTAGFGFAIGHIEYFPNQVNGIDEEHVVLDMIKGWDPRSMPGKVIRWEPILQEIVTLAEIFRPFEITMDQHQSAEPIQDLQERLTKKNIACRVYVVPTPQPLDAKVLTPLGWTTMGSLTVGQRVIGSDGHATNIIGVYPKGEQEVYRISFSDGSSTECTLDHVWEVKAHGERGKTHVLTLQEILERGLHYDSGITKSYKWSIRNVDPVHFDSPKALPIDPYLLGSLLGDGCFHNCVWMACASEDASEQEDILTPMLPAGMSVTRRNLGNWDTLYFKRPDKTLINPLSQVIRDLGLWRVAGSNKFIPEDYLHASIAERTALLQGLLDTDGSVRSDRYSVTFANKSLRLIEGVQDLVGSLGGSTTIYRPNNTDTLVVAIKNLPEEIIPFRLKRKAERYIATRPAKRMRRKIRDVELVGVKPVRCIRVSSSDHLYVTDDYILTHNTNETNWKRWEVFKTAAYQGRIHAPWDEEPMPSMLGTGNITSKDELKFLQQIGTSGRFPRIDKQDIGPVQTKDRADAACIVVHDLIGNMFLTTLQQRLTQGALSGGSPGGYGIGNGGYPTGGEGPPGISGYYSRRDEKMSQMGMTRASKTRGSLGGRTGGRSRGISPRGR